MDGGYAVETLLVALVLLAVGVLVGNIIGLRGVMKLRADSKSGRPLRVKAVIKWSVPAQKRGSSRAYAEYAVGERKIKGRMISASAERLTEGQTIKVFVSERHPTLFAVEERQISSAVTACAVMCGMTAVIAAFPVFTAVWRIVFG